jgi:TonB family protein
MELATYLAQVSLYWLLLYGCYWLVLRRHTFFAWNRAYLLGSLLGAFALPLVPYPEVAPPVPSVVYEMAALPMETIPVVVVETQHAASLTPIDAAPFPWIAVLWIIYALGVVIMAVGLFRHLRQVWALLRQGTCLDMDTYQLYLLDRHHVGIGSFSFLNHIVLNHTDYEHNFDTILSHELAHVRQRHSWDILLVEVLRVLLWFNPVLILYKKSLQQVHEYLADREVCAWEATPGAAASRDRYAEFMVSYALGTSVTLLANNFLNPNHLNNRITMLYKKRNSKWSLSKYAAVALLVGCVHITLAFKPTILLHDRPKNDTLSIPDDNLIALLEREIPSAGIGGTQFGKFIPDLFSNEIPLKSDSEQFDFHLIKDNDQPPSFPGGQEALQQFISQKITYPTSASRANVQGKVLLNFVVSAMGELQNMEVVKTPGFGLKEESLKLLAAMPTWVPGQKEGKKVAMHYNMTLDFQLSDYKTIVLPTKVGTLETLVKPDGENGSVAVVKFYPNYNRNRRTVNYRIFHNDTLQNALYILNAVPMKNRDFMKELTMDELQSVRVLDVATARRLYGEKGVNGIVQVFTKKSDKN